MLGDDARYPRVHPPLALIVGGFVLAALRWLVLCGRDGSASYQRLRQDLGRAFLLGLQVLVAADIVRTVAFRPTMNSVIVLAMTVAIPTFLSLSLALELDRRWPRQAEARSPEPA